MLTIEQIANKNDGLPVRKETKEGLWIGGLFVGREIRTDVFSEKVASCRYLVRCSINATHPRRMGEVMGSNGRFQAMTMAGDHVGNASSLMDAVDMLVAAKKES
jgi:hypothetical protein